MTAPATTAFAEEAAKSEQTRIVIDKEASEFRFIIDGETAAVLKKDGLHVREGIHYSAHIKDYGPEGFDNQTSEKPQTGSANAEE
jgi:hypothetical protein